MEPVTIILALCIPLAFGVGWRVGAGTIADLKAAEAKRHTQRMAALAKANAANRAKRDAS